MGGFVFVRSFGGLDALALAKSSLARMEFRGRDCSGVAWIEGDKIRVVKDSCPVGELFSRHSLDGRRAGVALGHTRYSTHGKADPRNAHPHVDCGGTVAVAGDGALRNYEDLYAELLERGHRLVSKSDFELLPHLIEEFVGRGSSYLEAFVSTATRLGGIVSAVALFRDGTAAAYTSHQPIYVGLGEGVVAISSTLSGLYGVAARYSKVGGGEVVAVTSGGEVVFLDPSGRRLPKEFLPYELGEPLVATDGFPRHMLREIYETPYSILRTASAVQSKYLELASKIILRSNRVFVVANGTSLHAGMVFSYYLSEMSGTVPVVVSASEFLLYHLDRVSVGDAVIAISQSGETSEVVRSAYESRLRGATVVGLTNNINSRLTRFSNLYLPIAAGPELAVPATKTFSSTLALLYVLARSVAAITSTPCSRVLAETWDEFEKLHRALLGELDRVRSEAEEASKLIAGCSSGYVVSRGITYPLALEGALKIKESAYVHAEGVEGGELRHGPIAILDERMFTVFIEPLEPAAAEDMFSVMEEVVGSGSPVVVVSHSTRVRGAPGARVRVVRVPSFSRHFMPISVAVALQLLAYSLASLRGVDVDRPRRLTKVVRI